MNYVRTYCGYPEHNSTSYFLQNKNLKPLKLSALILGVFLIGANSFILGPILGDVAQSLNTRPVAITRAISAFGAAAAFSAFFLSGLIDRIDTRIILTGSVTLIMIAFAGSAISVNWQMLALFQALAGFSTGILLPAIYAEAVMSAPEGQGARVLGIVLSGWSIALVAGVPVSALLSDVLNWRIAYTVLGSLAAALAIAFLGLKTNRPAEKAPALSRVQALRIAGAKSLLLTGLLFMIAFYGTYALLGHHIREVQNLNATLASTVVIAYGIGFGLGGASARQVDRLGPGRAFPFFLLASMVLYLALIAATHTLLASLGVAFLLGISNHFGISLVVLRLAQRNPHARGTLIGLNTTATYVAVFFGPLIMSSLYQGVNFYAVCVLAGALLGTCALLMWRIRNL